MVAVLAAGLLWGCKPQEPVAQAPGPEPVKAKPVGAGTGDDSLITSGPPRSPLPSVSPSPSPTPAATPAAGATKKYTIKQGDTFINIARTELGNEHRMKEIQALNPGVDASKLKVGQEILIPAK